MNRSGGFVLAIGLGFVATSAAEERKNELPPDAVAILEKAQSFELYSLSPEEPQKEPADKPKRFHDHIVLGKTVVKDAEIRKKLRTALLKGIADHPKYGAKCFLPRHGLRASHEGKTVELLICFECYRILDWSDGKKSALLTARSPQPIFDKVLKDAGVPLAAKPGK